MPQNGKSESTPLTLDTNFKMKSIKSYKDGCNALAKAFCEFYEFAPSSIDWVGDIEGDMCCIGDYFFSCEQMMYALEHKIAWDSLMEWYDYNIESVYYGFHHINIRSWFMGCPRVTEEQKAVLKALKEQNLLKNVDSYE